MEKIILSLSKMWLKVINLEQSLFPKLQESIGSLTPKKVVKVIVVLTQSKKAGMMQQIMQEKSQPIQF